MNATTKYADAVAEVAEILEYAPANPGPVAPDLRGWWVACADGEMYLCSRCAGRMLARSFNLPRNAEPVWRSKPEPSGVCAGCESVEFVPGCSTTGRASAIFAPRWSSPLPTPTR